MEDEALRNHCRRLVSVVRSKQQHPESSEERRLKHNAARGREVGSGPTCQGPEDQPVPPQLISMLRLKTLHERMKRAAEVELHDPAVCRLCEQEQEQEQASLALRTFIWRKKTQLQYQTLMSRLNTHSSFGCSDCKDRRRVSTVK